MKILKYVVGSMVAVFVGGFLLLGSDFTSMLRSSVGSVRQSVKESVPVEFELNRAKEKINEILPDLKSQVRMIAEEEVAISRLEKEVIADAGRVETHERKLASLRGQMRVKQVSYTVGQMDFDQQQFTDHLKSKFDHFKQAKLSLESKEKLLEKRKQGLSAAVAVLEQMRIRQSELKLKVESLAAQHRLIKASQIDTGTLVDGSQLSQADSLLNEIETRLAVAQKVMDYETDTMDLPEPAENQSAEMVLSEIDAYFGPAHKSIASADVE